MNKLPESKRIQILGCLTGGMAIRATSRITGASTGAILRLVTEIGTACEIFHYRFVRNVAADHLELDELWVFVGGRDARLSPARRAQYGQGSCWTWTALAMPFRLMLSYEVGTALSHPSASPSRLTNPTFSSLIGRMEMTTDLAVVSRARSGDPDAFRMLVESHSKATFRVAYRMTGNEHDADDVVQETFLRAYKQLQHFEERANFGTWLHRIAVNCSLDLLRARSRADKYYGGDPESAELAGAAGARSEAQQDRLILSAELQTQVATAMERLSASERTAFILRHFEGMPVEEIGKTLGIQVNAAKHTIFRAVRKLRESLEPLVRSTPCNT